MGIVFEGTVDGEDPVAVKVVTTELSQDDVFVRRFRREVKAAVGDTPYVSDFGLAKDSQASNLTRPGQALGSLDYMSPEQIRGEDVSPATDVYALGCVMWECLTGAPPFGGRPSMRVLFAHLQEPPPDLTSVRPDISAAGARAVTRALEKEPEDRPHSASDYVAGVARASGV